MAENQVKIVDEYSIALGPSAAFPTLLIELKLSDGSVVGPFEFAPAFAHTLADELCIASARAAKKVSGVSSNVGQGDGSAA
jgi:hypothetical protein